ncbi:MAG: DUF2088 domain-containing protein [Acidobacteria bacterium]|nr:DUF2088 domain-containing protein [Acidobacteriota bacterium]
MKSEIPHRLRTAAWYGDAPLDLEFPENWDVAWAWPDTPPPLEDSQIRECLARPTGQAPIRERCRGKRRPVVLVDDMNRPTPVARVMPFLLEEFRAAGIAAKDVTMIMARGSHGASPREAMVKKIGPEAAAACRFLLHNPQRNMKRIGKTSQGTPVLINRDVLSGDFVMGIGGVYPNHTTGFGGGTKLALGVLDLRVISHLHHDHDGAGWGSAAVENAFRREVDEMARMIGLETFITVHVDANREPVRIRTGDFRAYFGEEVRFARKAFLAPWPESADVVISNAYPNDLSLTFAQAKGDHPVRHCA